MKTIDERKMQKKKEKRKKYFNSKFSFNQNPFKDTSNVYYFKLPHIGNLSHHIKKKNFRNFAKSFVMKMLILS